MAKSKMVKVFNEIEENVVGTYKKIEDGAVGSFQKIADKFVDNYLTKEGESIEEAKARLNTEQCARADEVKKQMEERQKHQEELVKNSIEASLNAGKR